MKDEPVDGISAPHAHETEVLTRALVCMVMMRKGDYVPVFDGTGICSNLSHHMDGMAGDVRAYKIVETFSQGWKHHSGATEYPIPGSVFADYKWQGPQLQLRRSLLTHMIDRIGEELALRGHKPASAPGPTPSHPSLGPER